MIWIRRLFTVPLMLLFFVLLVLTLVLLRVSDTFLEPSFYKDHLSKNEVYEFALGELLSAAVADLREKDPKSFSASLEENPLNTLALTDQEIVSSIRTALPPAWLQKQVEQLLDQGGGYLTGEQEGFEITVMAGDRARAVVVVVEDLLLREELYDLLFEELVAPRVTAALEDDGGLPFNVPLNADDIVDAVLMVAPAEWALDRVEQALDVTTLYMVGDTESFEIRVQLGDRSAAALAAMKDLLKRASFADLLFEQVVNPLLEGTVSDVTQLPFGVSISGEEVRMALRRLVPPDWMEEQVLGVIDEAGPYLVGQVDTFKAVVPLSERKPIALEILTEIASEKLSDLVRTLPRCTDAQLALGGLISAGGGVPDCVPPGFSAQAILDRLDIDVAGQVENMIGRQIPDEIVYTQADLSMALTNSVDGTLPEPLEEMRRVLKEGWSYTEEDLRVDLLRTRGQGGVEQLDAVREALSGGWTYTEVELREDLTTSGNQDVMDVLELFREQLGRAREFSFLVYVLWAVVLLLIGSLGGRRWWSRFAWAAVTLFISSGLVFLAAGPVYQALGQDGVDTLRADVQADMEGTQLLAADMAIDILQGVADEFLVGIESASLTLLIGSAAVFGIALLWRILFVRSRQRQY